MKVSYFTRDGDPEIFTMDADGSSQTQLTANGVDDFEAAWSPAGDKITFTTKRDGNYETYSMNANGSGPVNLTNTAAPADEFLPDWQPLAASPTSTATPSPTPVATETPKPTDTPTPTPVVTTTLMTSVLAGATEIEVSEVSMFTLGSIGIISVGTSVEETFTVVGFGSILLQSPLQFDHQAGEPVALVSSDTPTPTPTATPAGDERIWGDHNCSGNPPTPIHSLLTLRFDAGLPVNTGDCPALGTTVEVADASPHVWGDIDCSGSVTPIDSLKLLRFDAGLSVSQADNCPLIGSQVLVTE